MACTSARALIALAVVSAAVYGCSRDSTSLSGAGASATTNAAAAPAASSAAAPAGDRAPDPQAAGGNTAPGSATELEVGKPAPDFTAKAHDGTDLHLAALKGKPVVVYFYPKDETPGCTKEACSFRDAWTQLGKKNAVLIGISADDDASHKKFAEHYKLPFHLVSDPDGAIAKSFGVPFSMGFAKRQTFVIGADGNVKKIYRTVDVTKHAAEIGADLS